MHCVWCMYSIVITNESEKKNSYADGGSLLSLILGLYVSASVTVRV